MKPPVELVLELETVQIEEALRLSGPYGNTIPGVMYLHGQMKHRGWTVSDAAVALEWLQETERSIMTAFNDYGGEG